MSDHVRSSAEIEREIEEERGALARSLESLQESLMPENLIAQVAGSVKDGSGDAVRAMTRAARDNPVAFTLAGAGLTMLLAGIGAKKAYDRLSETDDRPRVRVGYAAPTGDTAPGFNPAPQGRFEDRVSAADREIKHRDYAGRSLLEDHRTTWQKAKNRVRSAYGSIASGVSSEDLRARIADGTEKMSDAARERVMRARAKAISAQLQLEAKARKGGDDLMKFANDDPLIAGALVFVAGAAIGALLPRSSVENAYLGEHRDRLMDQADHIFREESAKLRAVASAAVAEGRAIVDEKIQSAYDAADHAIDSTAADAEEVLDRAKKSYNSAKDKVERTIADVKRNTPTGEDAIRAAEQEVKSAANRIAGAAKDEADRQNLGGSV